LARAIIKRSGFTLIELLVVLLIISIVTAIAVISFKHVGRDRHEKIAIEQLQNVIALAQQRAILQPAVLGLVFKKNAYIFYRYYQNLKTKTMGWKRLSEDHLSNTSISLSKITIDTGKKALKLFSETSSSIQPEIIFLPNGDVTPFTLKLNNKPVLMISRTGQAQLIPYDKK